MKQLVNLKPAQKFQIFGSTAQMFRNRHSILTKAFGIKA
jgi:hypothetical protein